MLKFLSFTSGSCGNCYFLTTGTDGLVIDAGVSLRRMKSVLAEYGYDYSSFNNVLVTHDHLDHIRNLDSFCKKLMKPVWATTVLHGALATHAFTRAHIASCRKFLDIGKWTRVGEFSVRPFVVPHDATQTVGYAISAGGEEFVIMTDLGRVTDEAVELASGASTVVIESNYDVDMLMGGSYPHELKMRIMQGHGHISNDECASAIKRFAHEGLKNVFLCHLSENNNTRELAYACSSAALKEAGCNHVCLRCLPRQYPSPLVEL
ncbi:MAG: MBL fold metallo-hydrolase [Bacteroidales bacterium]|nr:MBL fold metallo-hydrolase [Bacteroidales bacterium]